MSWWKKNKDTGCMTEEQFYTTVSIIAGHHGCRLIDIDSENHIINLEGPPEAETACAIALDDVLHSYIA